MSPSPSTVRAVAFPIAKPGSGGSELTGTTQVWFWCPGCQEAHAIQVGGEHPGPKWHWNGSLTLPTFAPSILTWHGPQDQPTKRCHSYVRDGLIIFLSDCTHSLANQTVELPEPPAWLRAS